MIRFILILCTWIFADSADHILLTRVVTQPDAAESISIYNPTDAPINLANYYICDDEDYYKLQMENDINPSSSISGFTVQFPDTSIESEDTFTIVLHENYRDFYGENFVADFVMFGSSDSSLTGSVGFGNDKINESAELIILFKWDGTNLIQDIDYFVWSSLDGITSVVDKTGIGNYVKDTPANEQQYFDKQAKQYYAYSRINTNEIDETDTA